MKEINKKLMALQQELKAPKSQYNEFNKFNYRSCEDILEAVKPLLASQGLTLTLSDQMEYIGQRYYIKATATLSDGEDEITATAYAREDERRAGMSESQVTGCSSSYARKYCLAGLLCLDDTKDSDAFNNRREQPSKPQNKPVQTPQAPKPTTTTTNPAIEALRAFCRARIKEEPEWKKDIEKFGLKCAEGIEKKGWKTGENSFNNWYAKWVQNRKVA